MVNLDYIKISNIDIGIYNEGPIGVAVSCGADSALLLYVLMNYCQRHIHIYNMMAEKRIKSLEKSFYDVVEKCSELTKNTNYTIHRHIVTPDESPEYFIDMLKQSLDKKECDIVYIGLTKFPPHEVIKSWPEQQPEWHNDFRSPDKEHPLFGFTISLEKTTDFLTVPLTADGRAVDKLEMDNRVYVPWFNCNKKDVAGMYDYLGLTSILFPITRSCENDDNIGSHCGRCWWCMERFWAFGQLGD